MSDDPVDDQFDHDEPTMVDKDKDAKSLQAEIDREAIHALTKRVTALEERIGHLGELVLQLIERRENLPKAD